MRELQDQVEHLQRENDLLQAQIENRHDLGERDVQDSSQSRHTIAHNKGKEPIILDNVDTLMDDELSSSSSPDLSPAKRSRSGRAKDTHIALHSATPIMAHSAGQEEKQVEGRTNQTECLGTHLHYSRA